MGDDIVGESILRFLEEEYNIKVLDKWQFTEQLFKLLTYLHENNFIKPIEINPTAKKLY